MKDLAQHFKENCVVYSDGMLAYGPVKDVFAVKAAIVDALSTRLKVSEEAISCAIYLRDHASPLTYSGVVANEILRLANKETP